MPKLDTLLDPVRSIEQDYLALRGVAWLFRDEDVDTRRTVILEAIQILDLRCPVCGGGWPWMYRRDPATKDLIDCTHEVVYV